MIAQRLLLLTALITSPCYVFAQNTTWLDNIASESGNLIDATIPTLFVLSFAVFVWGTITFIAKSADDTGREEGRKRMLWGVIALFLLVTVWGTLQLLQAILAVPSQDGGAYGNPVAPNTNLNL